MIFAYAQKQEIILKKPMDKVDPPKLAKKQVDALSPETAKNFFSALNDCPLDFRCMLHLMITTGMRRGESIGLKWGDIDETRSLVKIERNVTYTAKSGITVSTPENVSESAYNTAYEQYAETVERTQGAAHGRASEHYS